MAALSEKRVAKLCDADTLGDATKLTASSKGIASVCSLRTAVKLHRVDLSTNELKDLEFLLECCSLTWLNVSHNLLVNLGHLKDLLHLQVLNASHNEISSVADLEGLPELKALILNNNKLDLLPRLAFRELNTLVLSHNSLTEINVSSLPHLEKLQLSHNSLHTFPDLRSNHFLKIVSVNENCISKLQGEVLNEKNARLEILDLGKNKVQKLRSLKALHTLPNLRRLNLAGNPVVTKDDFQLKVRILCPHLITLDGKVLDAQQAKASVTKKKLDPAVSIQKEEQILDMVKMASDDSRLLQASSTTACLPEDVTSADDKNVHDSEEEAPVKKKKKKKGEAGSAASLTKVKSGVIAVKVVQRKKPLRHSALTVDELTGGNHGELGCGGGQESW